MRRRCYRGNPAFRALDANHLSKPMTVERVNETGEATALLPVNHGVYAWGRACLETDILARAVVADMLKHRGHLCPTCEGERFVIVPSLLKSQRTGCVDCEQSGVQMPERWTEVAETFAGVPADRAWILG